MGADPDATDNGLPTDRVQVVVRVRPRIGDELKEDAAITCNAENRRVQVVCPPRDLKDNTGLSQKPTARAFEFDACLGPESTQEEVYAACHLNSLVDAALDGYSVTVFAFGQTGAGKTHTVNGPRSLVSKGKVTGDVQADDGIVQRALTHAFERVEGLKESEGREFHVYSTFSEIYNEQVSDLLQPPGPPLHVRHNPSRGFYVEGLETSDCGDAVDALKALRDGLVRRKLASHNLNATSTRSHCMYTLHVDSLPSKDGGDISSSMKRYGRICFVDLAGSERLKETATVNAAETGNINKSLFALGKVISALSERGRRGGGGAAAHIPFRESKLTQLLMDSLQGSGRALMLACCAPGMRHADETLNTLHFASLALHVQSKPVVILDPADQLVLDLKNTISQLRNENRSLASELKKLAMDPNATISASLFGEDGEIHAPGAPRPLGAIKSPGAAGARGKKGGKRGAAGGAAAAYGSGGTRPTSAKGEAGWRGVDGPVGRRDPARPSSTGARAMGAATARARVGPPPRSPYNLSITGTGSTFSTYEPDRAVRGARGAGAGAARQAWGSSSPSAAGPAGRVAARGPRFAAAEWGEQLRGGSGGGARHAVASERELRSMAARDDEMSAELSRLRQQMQYAQAAPPPPIDVSEFPELAALEEQFRARLRAEPSPAAAAPAPAAKKKIKKKKPAEPEVEPEPKAAMWARRNRWFGADQEMTEVAYEVHDQLVGAEGVDPASDVYYDEIERRVCEAFPEKFAQYLAKGKKAAGSPKKKRPPPPPPAARRPTTTERALDADLRSMTKQLPSFSSQLASSASSAVYQRRRGSGAAVGYSSLGSPGGSGAVNTSTSSMWSQEGAEDGAEAGPGPGPGVGGEAEAEPSPTGAGGDEGGSPGPGSPAAAMSPQILAVQARRAPPPPPPPRYGAGGPAARKPLWATGRGEGSRMAELSSNDYLERRRQIVEELQRAKEEAEYERRKILASIRKTLRHDGWAQ